MISKQSVIPAIKVAIIGGSGFVGTRLMRVMKNDPTIQFINIDKRQSNAFATVTHIANVLNRKLLGTALKGVDLVVLLAAEHRDDVSPVSLYYDVNVQGMKNTLEAMEEN